MKIYFNKENEKVNQQIEKLVKKGMISTPLYGQEFVEQEGENYLLRTAEFEASSIQDVKLIGVIKKSLGEDHPIIYSEKADIHSKVDVFNNECDHCHTHRDRNKYFLFEKANGSIIKVGSTCVKDYLLIDGEVYNNIESIMDMVEGYGFESIPSMKGTPICQFRGFVSIVSECTEEFRLWEKGLTAKLIKSSFYGGKKTEGSILDKDTTDHIIQKIKELPADSDFNINIKSAIFESEEHIYVDIENSGALSYFIFKTVGDMRKEDINLEDSQYVGEEGERITVTVKILSTKMISTMYGESVIMNTITEEGNVVVWFDNKCQYGVDSIGSQITIKGTVKKHDLNPFIKPGEKVKATTLNRVKEVVA